MRSALGDAISARCSSSDVVIDMYCYRRHGHNEGDDPAFTQPLMYRDDQDHPSVRELYSQRLIQEGVTQPG